MSESKYIDLLSDIGFKNAFGKKGSSEEFLIDFLNQLLKGEPQFEKIESVEYRNVDIAPNHLDDKAVRYDLYCETNSGHRFIVEMQKRNKSNFKDRATYYLAREIYDQGARPGGGEWKYDLLPVIGVFLTNFYVNGLDRDLVVPGKILNPKTGNAVLNKMSCYFVQLEAFDKKKDECHTGFDKWIYILKNMERLQEIPFKEYKNQIFTRLGEISKVANLSEEEQLRYRDYLKWARDYHSELEYERNEGLQRGRKEGLEQGLAQGRKEEKRKWVVSLKALGMDIATISELSGLNEAEIASM